MTQEFNPRVYNFVLTPEFADSVMCWDLKSYKVALPSFSVLLDHTLAVIWHIFNNNGAELLNLNKADIGWALRFLEAIDTNHIKDTSDLEKLKNMMRKVLISRYAMEDEQEFLNKTQQRIDSIAPPSSSSALEEIYNSFEVHRDFKRQARKIKPTTAVCSDEEILKKLKELNPHIQTLNDVINMTMALGTQAPDQQQGFPLAVAATLTTPSN